jgi:hypothetical protein
MGKASQVMRASLLSAVAIGLALAATPAMARTIQFAGLTWDVKVGNGLGPGPNNWSDTSDSVWVDAQGQLHLKIRKVGSTWYCAEVTTQQSFGFKAYLFKVGTDVNSLDKNVVWGLFTYLNDTNEIDIEFSRWGNATAVAGQYVTQPAVTGNKERFDVSTAGTQSTHSFTWQAGSIFYQSYQGYHDTLPATPAQKIHEWNYTGSSIPPESTEKLHINLWLYGGTPPSNGQPVEVIVNYVRITDPALPGCTSAPQCDDGLFCTGVETCVDGNCQSSGNPCSATGQICSEAAGECVCDNTVVTSDDFAVLVGCLPGPEYPRAPLCTCSDRDNDNDVDLADFASFQLAFSPAVHSVVLFDFESGSQGWFSFGTGTTGNGLLPTGGSGGAGPQGRYHRADFDAAGMTYGVGDASAIGQNMSAYTGMSIDMRLRNHNPSDPFVGSPVVEFMLSINTQEWAKQFTLTDTYQTCAVNFADLVPQNTATLPITAAQLQDPNLCIKLIMRKASNHGQVELDYDQVRGTW